MSEPKTKPADIFETVRARAVEYAKRIPPALRDRIAAWAGAQKAGPKDDPAVVCVTAAATSEGTRRILAAIDRDVREALLFFLCGSDALDERQFEDQLRTFFGWSKTRTRTTIVALADSGLLVRMPTRANMLDAFPALRLGLGPDLLVWLAGATDDAPPVTPFARRLALLVAHMHADPMTLTAQGALTVRWMDRAQEVFAAAGSTAQLLVGCAALLQRTGALGLDPNDPDGKSWRVDARWRAPFSAPPSDLALAFAESSDGATWGTLLGTLAMLDRAVLAGDAAPTLSKLSELGRAWVTERGVAYVPYYEGQFRPLAVASALRTLAAVGLVSLARIDGVVRVSRVTAPAPPPSPFRCTVLPTFEIWVAADADPAGTAELGRIADLTETDRVARFTLTQKSVARTIGEPGGAAAAIERLATAAEHGLPDNVRSTLEGWAKRATAIRAFRGAFVVTATDDQATFVRGRSGVLGEIAPGLFHVDGESLSELLKAAEKAGHLLAPVIRDGRTRDRYGGATEVLGVGKRADDLRARIAAWAKPPPARPAAEPKPISGTFVPSPYGTDDLEDDPAEAEPLTAADLRREWPAVGQAVRGYPPHEHVACGLEFEELEDLEDLGDPRLIRNELVRLAIAVRDPRPTGGPRGPATPPPPTPPPTASPPPAPGPAVDEPWITPKPGALVQLLAGAAFRQETLDIVYINTEGVRRERRIIPLEIVHSGRREWLSAQLTEDHSTNRFELDRIAAVRVVRT